MLFPSPCGLQFTVTYLAILRLAIFVFSFYQSQFRLVTAGKVRLATGKDQLTTVKVQLTVVKVR